MKIYLINCPCDDSYYQGHSTGIAFKTEAEAMVYCRVQNDKDEYDDYHLYYSEVEVLDPATYNNLK